MLPMKNETLKNESYEKKLQGESTLFSFHLFFSRVESFLIFVIGLFIVGFVLIALLGVINEIREPLLITHNFTEAALKGIDVAFLAIILLELLHTIRSQSSLTKQLQEFLIIGITSAVRHGLELAATSTTGVSPQSVVINLTINALAVFILVCSLWIAEKAAKENRRIETKSLQK